MDRDSACVNVVHDLLPSKELAPRPSPRVYETPHGQSISSIDLVEQQNSCSWYSPGALLGVAREIACLESIQIKCKGKLLKKRK